jgi:predicted ribosome quality control (RQC) complex YloA/Tae2 family protein
VANIYNVDAKTYVFKLSRSEHKDFLIIENGVRFNLTDE